MQVAPLVAAANVDGELEVFARYLRQSREFRLTLRFKLQRSEMRRAVMLVVATSRFVLACYVDSKCRVPRVRGAQRRSTTYADT